MIFEHGSYRTYLRQVLSERIKRNPSYSLRAMARSFSVAPSLLSSVLSGKKNFSYERSISIARKLELNSSESECFSLLVQHETANTPEAKLEISERLRKFRPSKASRILDADHFSAISEWFHIPMVEMAEVIPLLTPAVASDRLGITVFEAEVALDRLIRIGLLVRNPDGTLSRGQESFFVRSPRKAEAITQFHKGMHQKGIESLDRLSRKESWIGTETFSISPTVLPEMHAITEEYLTKMVRLAKKGDKKTAVYHLMVHLFNLTPEKGKSV